MRAIPSELLERVKKKWQVPAENSGPAMKVYLSRGFINELFQVFTIQEGAELTDVDVTVKRTDTSAEPAEAYALAINDGVAQVKSKPLPYDDQIPWVDRMTVALSATAVAIEFDGYWDRDYATRRFNFVTEEYPWLFYVQGGTLYAKYWEDAEITLATDVVKVCAIRGWLPANGDQSNDQGLIVAYIKTDGLVYYRSYCIQVGGGKLWEVERNVAEVLTTCTDLALFRTNDFRIGFMISTGGVMYWLLTARNWAGMSIWPDTLTASVSAEIEMIPITYIDGFSPDETLIASVSVPECELCAFDVPDPALVSATRLELNKIVLEFNQQVIDFVGSEDAFTVSFNSGAVVYDVLSVTAGASGNKIVLTIDEDVSADANLDIAYSEFSAALRTYVTDYCRRLISSFATIAEGQPPIGYVDETLTAAVSADIQLKYISKLNGFNDDHTLTASVSALIAFWHIDDAPV